MADNDELKWVHEPSHPEHPLKQIYNNATFRCDLCRTKGEGTRLRCDDCKYTLHEGCSALPDALPPDFFAHRHPLHLTSKPGLFSFHKCFFCGHSIRGASFKCNECDVFLHPLCTRVKEVLPAHDIHPIHELRLEERSASGKCDVCRKKCKKWRYYCGACKVHVHVECLTLGIDKVRARQAAQRQQMSELVGLIGNIGGLSFSG